MIMVAAQPLPVPDSDPGDARERAEEILARAEFSTAESILDRAGRWLDELFSSLFESLAGGGAGTVVGWLILVGLVLVAVRVVSRWGSTRRSASTRGPRVDVAVVAGGDGQRSAAAWNDDADRLAAEGRYDEAVRARYRGVLAALVEAGLVDDVAGRTTGEYRRDVVAARPAAAPPFGALTDHFELVWYGPRVATAGDLELVVEDARRVVEGLHP